MNTIEHAKNELQLYGWLDSDEMSTSMCKDVLELLETFSKQGHSGFSVPYAISLFEKLAKYEPLTPLTGDDSEWDDDSEYNGNIIYQNKRCSRVFKNSDEVAYDIVGKVFVLPDGGSYTSSNSRVNITFPYEPKPEYVNVQF